jgi:transcriptional regulator with XRE-family HTH domain
MILRRKQLGMTQKDFGGRMGTSERNVQRWEAGDARMKIDDLEKALVILGIHQVMIVPGECVVKLGGSI